MLSSETLKEKKKKVHINLWYNRVRQKIHTKETYMRSHHLTTEEHCRTRKYYKKSKSFRQLIK